MLAYTSTYGAGGPVSLLCVFDCPCSGTLHAATSHSLYRLCCFLQLAAGLRCFSWCGSAPVTQLGCTSTGTFLLFADVALPTDWQRLVGSLPARCTGASRHVPAISEGLASHGGSRGWVRTGDELCENGWSRQLRESVSAAACLQGTRQGETA